MKKKPHTKNAWYDWLINYIPDPKIEGKGKRYFLKTNLKNTDRG